MFVRWALKRWSLLIRYIGFDFLLSSMNLKLPRFSASIFFILSLSFALHQCETQKNTQSFRCFSLFQHFPDQRWAIIICGFLVDKKNRFCFHTFAGKPQSTSSLCIAMSNMNMFSLFFDFRAPGSPAAQCCWFRFAFLITFFDFDPDETKQTCDCKDLYSSGKKVQAKEKKQKRPPKKAAADSFNENEFTATRFGVLRFKRNITNKMTTDRASISPIHIYKITEIQRRKGEQKNPKKSAPDSFIRRKFSVWKTNWVFVQSIGKTKYLSKSDIFVSSRWFFLSLLFSRFYDKSHIKYVHKHHIFRSLSAFVSICFFEFLAVFLRSSSFFSLTLPPNDRFSFCSSIECHASFFLYPRWIYARVCAYVSPYRFILCMFRIATKRLT